MVHTYPKYVTREAMNSLIEKLDLPQPIDHFEQDWEYLVSDIDRIPEFLSFFEQGNLSLDEKFTLMIIVVDSYNDAMWAEEADHDTWRRIEHHLISEAHIHRETILYWALMEDDKVLEDCFAVTPYMREIVKVLGIQNLDKGEHP